ncbi:hypothetical protein [Burkholderia gladioli]|uniref:hypothetical protein n=1 Tax=Burkholderia gladioli TaxID=28095 RepID=UPI00163F3F5A|nr:hypothetical protein [Burkholderia gladioli]
MTSRQNIKPSTAQRLVMQPLTDAAMREALDEFELVCENNDARKLTDDEKYAAQEFALSLIHSAPSAEAEATEKLAPILTLTGAQLLEALDLIAPDRAADQLESEVSFQYGKGHEGEGMYCWMTEYPDEGATKIDGSTAAAQAVAADGAIPTADDVQSWAVTVEVNGMTILTISDSHVGGIDSIGDFGDVVRSCAQHLTSFIGKDDAERAAVSPATADAPLNGIAATMFHGEGAIARCSYCGRYSIDRQTLGDRAPKCECGEKHGWSGSFEKPGPDAKWSGASPAGMTATADERAALREMLDDARNEFTMVREALGIAYEPHQTLLERTLDAARASQAAAPADARSLPDDVQDTLKLAIGYIGSSERADRHEHIARIQAILAGAAPADAQGRQKFDMRAALSTAKLRIEQRSDDERDGEYWSAAQSILAVMKLLDDMPEFFAEAAAAPADAREPVGRFDKSINQIRWRDGLVNADFADRQPFYTHPVNTPADAGVLSAARNLIDLRHEETTRDHEIVAAIDALDAAIRDVPADAGEAVDAARYRVIRTQESGTVPRHGSINAIVYEHVPGTIPSTRPVWGDELDRLADSARAQGAQGGKGGEA